MECCSTLLEYSHIRIRCQLVDRTGKDIVFLRERKGDKI